MYDDDALLPLSGLQHLAFCERQWALIHLEEQWDENYDTARGLLFHERVHSEGYSHANGIRAVRGVRLVSRELGLYGVADIVEYSEGGIDSVVPVEYKVGKPKLEDWDRIQVAAQAMCLEEMSGIAVECGALFYGQTRRRESVEIGPDLRARVIELCRRMHQLFEKRKTPLVGWSSKCRRCSLNDACLPTLMGKDAASYWRRMTQGIKD